MKTFKEIAVEELHNAYENGSLDYFHQNQVTGVIEMKCTNCGDTDKHNDHGHMYIMNYKKPNMPLVYYCVKCGISGIVNPDFLELSGIYDPKYKTMYLKEKKNYDKHSIYKKGFNLNNVPQILIKAPLKSERNFKKINYIENRLGIKLTTKKIMQYKIVFDILDFLQINNINKYTRHDNIMKALNEQYVGFLTTRNEFVNMRNIGEIDKFRKRYIIYNIFNFEDNSKKFYILSTQMLNVMKPITLILCEGPFDLIGIKEHIYPHIDLDEADRNYIFGASCGMSYESLIKYIVKLGFVIDIHVNIYSDNSVPLDFYRNIKNKLKGYCIRYTIYYNIYKDRKQKTDFGVPKDNIVLDKYTI